MKKTKPNIWATNPFGLTKYITGLVYNMSIKKSTSFNSIVHSFAKNGLNLSRRDNLVFYKLLGFLLRNDLPFPYSNEKLTLNTLYSLSAIKEAINNLEKLGLIDRIGFSYKRRFYKGKTLVNICTHSQYCIDIELNNNSTHGQKLAGTSQKLARTGQNPARIERKENLGKLKDKVLLESINVDQKAQDEAHDKRTREYRQIIAKRKLTQAIDIH